MSVLEAIKALQNISNELVILPDTQAYDKIISSYFTELERELRPACFLVPKSTDEVAAIVKGVKSLTGGLYIAICGAGQQATPEVANVHNGLTIHLRNLRGVEVDVEKTVVSIAAGEQMGKVYEKVMAVGFGVVGNRHSSGGIGGDAVQGGLSYFSYDRGFVCDDVVNYEFVLADGAVVNANAETNKDLFAALKGGGNNFGIVTRFDLRIFPLGRMWGGKTFYFQPSFPGQIKSLIDYLHNPSPETNVHICLSLGYAAALGDILCMNDIFCASPAKPKALEPFADVHPQIDQMNTLRVDNLKNFTDEAFAGASPNRVVKMTTTVKADASILEYAVETFRESFKELKSIDNILFSVTFEPIPVSMIQQSNARGQNALGLNPSSGPLVVILFYTSWDNTSDTKHIYKVNKKALASIEAEAKSKSVAANYRYLNYAFPHQDPIGSYGYESRARLQAVSSKYDPEGFFQSVVAGPFKLSK